MTLDQALTELRKSLGFRSESDTAFTEKAMVALQQAQDERERPGKSLPQFLISHDEVFAVTAASQVVSYPTGFIKFVDSKEGGLRYLPSGATIPYYIRKRQLKGAYAEFSTVDVESDDDIVTSETIETGRPVVYVPQADRLLVFPVPDANYTLLGDVYKHDDELTSGDVENGWLLNAPWLLIADAGIKLAKDVRDKSALELFIAMQSTQERQLLADVVALEHVDEPIIMGSRL